MKRILILASLLVTLVCCKKDKEDDTSSTPTPDPIGEAPSSFTRKILIEHFTGEWNPNCPTGDDSLRAMIGLDTNQCIAVSIHQGDWLAQTAFFDSLSNHLGGVNGFPRASFNRRPALYGSQLDSLIISIFNWRQNLLPMMNQSASCGLALHSKVNANTVNLSVHAASNQSLSGDIRLSLYLIEDSIPSQNQLNAPAGYIHNYVLRKALNNTLGDTLTLSGIGKQIRNYTFDITGKYITKSNLKLIAFIHKVGTNPKEHEVLNTQQSRLNETKMWN